MYSKPFFKHSASLQPTMALSVKSKIFLLESCLFVDINLLAKIKSMLFNVQEEWKC